MPAGRRPVPGLLFSGGWFLRRASRSPARQGLGSVTRSHRRNRLVLRVSLSPRHFVRKLMKFSSLALVLAGIVPALASDPVQVSYNIQTVAGSSKVGDGGPAISAALSDAQGVAVDA